MVLPLVLVTSLLSKCYPPDLPLISNIIIVKFLSISSLCLFLELSMIIPFVS